MKDFLGQTVVTTNLPARLHNMSLSVLQVGRAFAQEVGDPFAAPHELTRHRIQWSSAMTQLPFTTKTKQKAFR